MDGATVPAELTDDEPWQLIAVHEQTHESHSVTSRNVIINEIKTSTLQLQQT